MSHSALQPAQVGPRHSLLGHVLWRPGQCSAHSCEALLCAGSLVSTESCRVTQSSRGGTPACTRFLAAALLNAGCGARQVISSLTNILYPSHSKCQPQTPQWQNKANSLSLLPETIAKNHFLCPAFPWQTSFSSTYSLVQDHCKNMALVLTTPLSVLPSRSPRASSLPKPFAFLQTICLYASQAALCPLELSVMLVTFRSVFPNMEASSHTWLLSTWNMASTTEELDF